MTVEARTRMNEPLGTFSERFPVLYNIAAREKKADKIISVCTHFSPRPLEKLVCLDLGASTGIMTDRFAHYFRRTIAVDVDRKALAYSHASRRGKNIVYVCTDGTRLGLPDSSVDVVICNQIYEHVDDQSGLVDEIYRVLRPDGFCYFGAGNRHVIIEGHYFLPFLSWLPPRLADLYMWLTGKKRGYDVRLLSLRKLRRLTDNFWCHDYTRMIFENPVTFQADDVVRPGNFMARLPRWLYAAINPLLPAWVWILTKKK